MNEIKKVLVCGIGAIGSIYADKIEKYSPENLRVLVDETRFERYKKNPTFFNDRILNFNYILPSATDFKADLIIIATKFDGLNDVIQNIKNFVKEDTVILSLLNGVTSEKIIAKTYGAEKLLYSYYIGHSAVRNGRHITHDGVNTIVFGSDNVNDIKNENKVKIFFEKVGINYLIPKDIIHSLWLKYMLNVSANQTTAIFRMTFGEMFENEKCMEFAINIMKEVQAIAKVQGVNNSETLIDEALESLKTMTPDGKTSMLQDVEAGRKTEVDMFAGTIIKMGLEHNIPTPYNKIIKEILEIIYRQQEISRSKLLTNC